MILNCNLFLILIENDQYQSPQPPWQGPLCFLVVEHIYVHLSKGPPLSLTISAHAEAWANVHSSGRNSNISGTNWPLASHPSLGSVKFWTNIINHVWQEF